ncbi:MAG: DUF3237 domain-containing protein [Candidatus Sericytochromatia bacterium]
MTATLDHTDQLPLLDTLPVQHLCDMHVDLEPAHFIASPFGTRLTFVTKGGAIDGPGLQGQILPGGGDWLIVGSDRVGRIDVRATIRTHDGELIHFETHGIVKIPTDGMQRLTAGEVLPFDETYVRTTPKFETATERYGWLSEVIAVGYNILSPNHIDYRIYTLL